MNWKRLFWSALGNTPDDRFKSADALANDLERFLKHEPIVCKRPALSRRASLFARRNRRVLTVASVAAVLLAVVVTWASTQLSAARTTISNANAKGKELDKRLRAAKIEATAKAREAEDSNRREQATRYLTDMKTAWRTWRENRPEGVRAILDRHAPSASEDGTDLRKFEWYYLDRLLASGYRSLAFGVWPHAARSAPTAFGSRSSATAGEITCASRPGNCRPRRPSIS